MVPYVDMINHFQTPNVEARLNSFTNDYEVISTCDIQRGQELLFSYGWHDNCKLLVEYGFILDSNPHAVLWIDDEWVKTWIKVKNVLELLSEGGWLDNMSFPSFAVDILLRAVLSVQTTNSVSSVYDFVQKGLDPFDPCAIKQLNDQFLCDYAAFCQKKAAVVRNVTHLDLHKSLICTLFEEQAHMAESIQ